MSRPDDRVLPEGVKATTGDVFDPDEHYIYFLAGEAGRLLATEHPQVLVAVNELKSRTAWERFDRLLDTRRVLLDSGIFNLAMEHARKHDTSHDVGLSMPPEEIDGFDRLWDNYGEIVTRFGDRLWGAIELDQGGREHKPRTRARIEEEFGIVPIPVYHPLLDGWDYYDDLARGYDRMCFGNIVKASPPVRLRLMWTAAERARAYPYLWTHLLGATPNQNLIAMAHRGSSDSSSWLTNLRWMPSWKAFSMLASVAAYPPDMWVDVDHHEGQEDRRSMYERGSAVSGNVALGQHLMMASMREDTHPWL